MCGIVGYLGNNDYYDYIINGLKLLQNRGYDSAGISFLNNELYTFKYASSDINNSIDLLEENILKNNQGNQSNIAIGHTRWATHGSKTNNNAHPHNDLKNEFSIVHNGIIENYQELKEKLKNENIIFKSETDTEVIAILLGKFFERCNSIEKSIEETVKLLQGTWALVIIHKKFPNKIWLTRNGSPLLVGIDDNFVIIASEQLAFNNCINKYAIIIKKKILDFDYCYYSNKLLIIFKH